MNTDTITDNAPDTDLDTQRKLALARHLDIAAEDIDTEISPSRYSDTEFDVGRQSYLVCTDAEADDLAVANVSESLWAFRVNFLSRYIPALRDRRAAKAWEKLAGELCDDAGPLVEAMLGDRLSEAVQDAVREDGRGHFLAGYDCEEREETVDGVMFYIYRTN